MADGNLQITAINVPRGNKQYQSGMITSQTRYGIGRYEARIDLPTTQGMWPAFWLNPNGTPLGRSAARSTSWKTAAVSRPSPAAPTIGKRIRGRAATNMNMYSTNTRRAQNGSPVNFHSGFHTYAVEWEETRASLLCGRQSSFHRDRECQPANLRSDQEHHPQSGGRRRFRRRPEWHHGLAADDARRLCSRLAARYEHARRLQRRTARSTPPTIPSGATHKARAPSAYRPTVPETAPSVQRTTSFGKPITAAIHCRARAHLQPTSPSRPLHLRYRSAWSSFARNGSCV